MTEEAALKLMHRSIIACTCTNGAKHLKWKQKGDGCKTVAVSKLKLLCIVVDQLTAVI